MLFNLRQTGCKSLNCHTGLGLAILLSQPTPECWDSYISSLWLLISLTSPHTTLNRREERGRDPDWIIFFFAPHLTTSKSLMYLTHIEIHQLRFMCVIYFWPLERLYWVFFAKITIYWIIDWVYVMLGTLICSLDIFGIAKSNGEN